MRENEQDFIGISINEGKNRVEVSLRGVFPDPNQIGEQILQLSNLSESYDVVLVTINSPGGDAASLSDILSVLKQYQTCITVGVGMVASAGFLLWGAGDVRVVKEYTTFMAHRESYIYHGKTAQHTDLSQHWESVGDRMMKELIGPYLTVEELEKSRYTEVFLNDVTMLERRSGISWLEFQKRDNMGFPSATVVEIDDVEYTLVGDGTAVENETGYVYKVCDLVYNKSILEPDVAVEEEVVEPQYAINELNPNIDLFDLDEIETRNVVTTKN